MFPEGLPNVSSRLHLGKTNVVAEFRLGPVDSGGSVADLDPDVAGTADDLRRDLVLIRVAQLVPEKPSGHVQDDVQQAAPQADLRHMPVESVGRPSRFTAELGAPSIIHPNWNRAIRRRWKSEFAKGTIRLSGRILLCIPAAGTRRESWLGI